MTHYIALIHKDPGSCYGVSFPDVPGAFSAGDTLDEAIAQATELLAFSAEDWEPLTGSGFPRPRSLDELRHDPVFLADAEHAVIAAIPFDTAIRQAAE